MELHGTVEFVSGSSRYCFSSAGCLFTLLLAVFRQPSSNGAGKAGITHDFLSLHKERPLQNSRPPPSPGHVGVAARGAAAIDLNVVAASAPASSSELGFGRRIVKPELSSCGPSSSSAESAAGNGGGATAVFRQRSEVAGNRGGPHPPQWPSTSSAAAAAATAAVAHGGIFPPSSGQLSSRDAMDASSRLKGFADEEEEDEEEFMRDTPSRKGLTVKVDGGSNSGDGTNDDRKPSTPRSKHSATEQRRRSKINDRFQILRNLIPNTDQKRDKASFLLEVIEYIQVLQEKVNKYESPYPVWNQDNAKLTPWKSSQAPDGITAATTNPLVYPMDGGAAAGVPLMPATLQQFPLGGTGVPGGGGFGFFPPQARTMSGPADHGRVHWPRPSSSSVASAGGHGAGGDAEDLVIDEGTVSLSSAYSDGLLSAFTEALEGSGLDLSQASISVRINLGRQALRPFSATAAKDAERSSGEDSEHQRRPAKRRSASGGSGG